ncbi:ecotin, putative [Leishmania tarentolae]|uniref:Ecotin-like protein 3 n=1 Tax=Leishmania tarentolae TaxID=5689 RepID=A0A640KIC6_LEITA|nr:ecotin, putative [Leishmania tarentolae]
MPSLQDYHAPYPVAAPGQVRKVIYLPQQDPAVEQQHLRVQLIPGRQEHCEDGRLYKLTGSVREETVEGCGYSYYVVVLGGMSTDHRALSDPENATTFVALPENPMIAYNSKLPIVVYVPQGAEVRYRIWADDASLVQRIQQQSEATDTPQPHVATTATRQERSLEHSDSDAPEEYVTYGFQSPMTPAEEVSRRSNGTPHLAPSAVHESADQAHATPPPHPAETEASVPQLTAHVEVCPQANDNTSDEQPVNEVSALEQCSRSFVSPGHKSANELPLNRPQLSSTEIGPQEKSKSKRSSSTTQKPRRSTGGSNIDEANGGSSKQSRSNGSSTFSKWRYDDNSYEKMVKNLWNRVRRDSPQKASAAPKSSDNIKLDP